MKRSAIIMGHIKIVGNKNSTQQTKRLIERKEGRKREIEV